MYTFCIQQDVCNCCIQNLYAFRQTFVYILYTKLKELCQLNFVYKMYTKGSRNMGYISYTSILYVFCIQTFAEMWNILYTNILYTFCINFVYKKYRKGGIRFAMQTSCMYFVYNNSDLQKVYIINIICTICIQNSYRMHIQIIVCRMVPLFQHILTHLYNHCKYLGLRLETCWLIR